MEFRDLRKQYQLHQSQIDSAIQDVLLSSHFIGGEQVKQLEGKLADYVGVKHCITCANGTDALQLALMAWGIGKEDAVFVPDFTFFSSGEVVPFVGATPIFVDIDANTYNISCKSLQDAIEYTIHRTNLKPRVIVAVDLFGQPADFQAIRAIAEKYSLLLLEDAAQGFGGMMDDRMACSFGDISTTSFFPAKPLGCYGDGGAIFTNDDAWAEKLRSLCVHGKGSDKYDNVRIGMNSRLDAIQAAVLMQKLSFFEEEIVACNCVAERYSEQLHDIVKTPVILQNMRSSWAQYTICLKDAEERNKVMAQLKADGIPSAVYYKKPMHEQQAFAEGLIEAASYAQTQDICERCLSLPMHPYMEDEQIQAVCDSVKKVFM